MNHQNTGRETRLGVEWVHTSEESRWEKLGWTVITEPRACVSTFLFMQNVTSGNWRIKIRIPHHKLLGQLSVESSLADEHQWSCIDFVHFVWWEGGPRSVPLLVSWSLNGTS